MGSALLAAFFFALSAVFAHRTTSLVGVLPANLARVWLAAGMLAVLTLARGGEWQGAALPTFVFSGVIGYGLGDLSLFAAYPRLGSRLTSLLMQCLSAPFAAAIEWLWLGTRPSVAAMVCGATILVGVALAIAPAGPAVSKLTDDAVRSRRSAGLVFGVLAALGQAGGAVTSRKAFAVARAAGESVDGLGASFQRILGGVAVISVFYLLARGLRWHRQTAPQASWRVAWPWIVANALAGATLGVSFFQRALATTPSAVVMPIIALTPLIVVPFAYFLEHERPSIRSLLGGAVAVAAASALAWVEQN